MLNRLCQLYANKQSTKKKHTFINHTRSRMPNVYPSTTPTTIPFVRTVAAVVRSIAVQPLLHALHRRVTPSTHKYKNKLGSKDLYMFGYQASKCCYDKCIYHQMPHQFKCAIKKMVTKFMGRCFIRFYRGCIFGFVSNAYRKNPIEQSLERSSSRMSFDTSLSLVWIFFGVKPLLNDDPSV